MSRKYRTKIIFAFWLMAFFIHVICVRTYADEPLIVNISEISGESILIKDGTKLVTASPVVFSIASDDECYYRVSNKDMDDSDSFIKMNDKTLTLYPDKEMFQENEFVLKFMTQNADGENVRISNDVHVRFDLITPGIEVINPNVLDECLRQEAYLSLKATDDVAIKRIVVKNEDEILFEKYFEQSEVIKEYDFDVELNKKSKDLNGTKLSVEVYDFASNERVNDYNYFLDDTSPSMIVAGLPDGEIDTKEVQISAFISDDCIDGTYFDYELKKDIGEIITTLDGQINLTDTHGIINIPIIEEGSYSFCGRAVDRAGNSSKDISTSFVIDSTAPEIRIDGAYNNVDIRNQVQLTINVKDEICDNCAVNVSVMRQRDKEVKYLPVSEFVMSQREEKRLLNLVNDGDYTVCVSARDAAGNCSECTRSFRIDSGSPILRIGGLNEGEITNSKPIIRVGAKETFYDATIIEAHLFRMNQQGLFDDYKDYKYVMKNTVDYQDIEVSEEGVYRLVCVARDRSGNEDSKSIDFTVDYTPPVIGDMDNYDGKYLESFKFAKKIGSIISDMSAYTYEAFLNDKILSDEDIVIDEGKYLLVVGATDAANNYAEKSATFIIDHTKPQIVLKGVSADGNIKKGSIIEVGLFDEKDILDNVIFNEQQVTVDSNKTAQIEVGDYGDYHIEVKAHDLAGNVIDQVIYTSCVMKGMVPKDYVKTEKTISQNIVKHDDFDIDYKGIIIGVITALAGTFGLVIRGVRTH